MSDKSAVLDVERMVVKVGTGFLYKKCGDGVCEPKQQNISGLVEEISKIAETGVEVALVSSGAIAAASHALKVPVPSDEYARARMAGIGQPFLIGMYVQGFQKHSRNVAQFLVCKDDFGIAKNRRNLRNNQGAYFRDGIIAVYNENDLIAIDEIKYGDNDGLAADIACLLDADMLVMLSDPNEGLGTGGGKSKDAARAKVLQKRIRFEIVNGGYELSESGIYRPKIRNLL